MLQYRVFLASLFLLIVFAYMDTAAVMKSFNEKHLFREYKTSNKVLGIGVENVDSTTVKVVKVFNGTPAYKSGIATGDIIIRVGNKEVLNAREFKSHIDNLPSDKKVSLIVFKPSKKEFETLSLLPDAIQR